MNQRNAVHWQPMQAGQVAHVLRSSLVEKKEVKGCRAAFNNPTPRMRSIPIGGLDTAKEAAVSCNVRHLLAQRLVRCSRQDGWDIVIALQPFFLRDHGERLEVTNIV